MTRGAMMLLMLFGGSVDDEEPTPRRRVERVLRAAAREDLVRVGQVEDVHARDDAHAAERERLVDRKSTTNRFGEAHVAERAR